jgi:Ca2+-binding RTX toxin-like protein
MAVFPGVIPSIGNDLITGTGGIDFLTGFYGNDTIRGGAGNDIIVEAIFAWPSGGFTLTDGFQVRGGLTYDFGRGNDSIDGGAGMDLLTYDDRRVGIVVNLALGQVTTGTEVDRFVGIEALELGNGADLVYANKAGFVVDLSAGNDRVIGMAGQSLYIGGDGNDTLDLSGFKTPVKVFLDMFTVQVGVNTAQLQEFETVLGSLIAANTMRGNDFANTLVGGAGNDVLDGRSGTDLLEGGAGNDRIFGGMGVDTLYGGSGNDYILTGPLRDGGPDPFDSAYGGDGQDILVASVNNIAGLYGGAGNDLIYASNQALGYGGEGDDHVFGTMEQFFYGAPPSRFNGGNGFDTLTLSGRGEYGIKSDMSGFERVIFAGNENKEVYLEARDTNVILQGGIDRVEVRGAATNNYIYTGAGFDTVQVTNSAQVRIFTGDGGDVVRLGATNAGSVIDTGEGADGIDSFSAFVTIRSGSGGDRLMISSAAGGNVDTGAGNDVVQSAEFVGQMRLGSGDDQLFLEDSFSLDGFQVWGGEGKDIYRQA